METLIKFRNSSSFSSKHDLFYNVYPFHPNNPVYDSVFSFDNGYFIKRIKKFVKDHPEWTGENGVSFKNSLDCLFTDRNNENIKIGNILMFSYCSSLNCILIIGNGRGAGVYYKNLTTGYQSFLINVEPNRYVIVAKSQLTPEERKRYEEEIKQREMSWLE